MKKIKILFVIFLFILVGCSNKKDSVPSLVQIRKISNLATLECYYHNVAKSVQKKGSGILNIGEKDRKYWLEYTGVVRIGIDMSLVKMEIKNNEIVISLPKAKVLSSNVLKDDYDKTSIYTSDDSWFNKNKITAESQKKAITDAQNQMLEEVNKNTSLFAQAEERAEELIKNYIVQLGEISGIEYQVKFVYN